MEVGNWITIGVLLITQVGSLLTALRRIEMKTRDYKAEMDVKIKELEVKVNNVEQRVQDNRSDMNNQYINQEKAMTKLEQRMDSNFDELFKKLDKINDYLLNTK